MVQTDACRTKWFGFVLHQRHGEVWKLVQCRSRLLTDAESRYAVIEMELGAVLRPVKKCGTYFMGLPHFYLIVDHRPLVPILNTSCSLKSRISAGNVYRKSYPATP